jgi:peptidoglycan-associated lipoprotein
MHKTVMVLLFAAVLGMAGCKSKRPLPDSSAGTNTQQSGADAAGADPNGAGVGDTGEGTEVQGPQEGLLAKRVIYFDFDSSDIRGEGTDIVAAHAKHVAGSPNVRVRLEGHTDERGSREYNIGLGERRAQAVRRALMLQGAADTQLSTVSYGEERPVGAGSDEAAWTQNRRVEIVYLQ